MPCLLLILVLAFPRVVLVLIYLMDPRYLLHVYHGLIVPLLGFLFLPLTTLAYAWMFNSHRPLTDGVNVVILIIAVVIDLGGLSGGEWHRRSRW
jgi:hypothetical protein